MTSTNAAESTFAARFTLRKIGKIARHFDHAGIFVHHHQTAGTHHRANRFQRIKIDRRLHQGRRQTTPGGSADLHRFELLTILNPATNINHQMFQGNPHGNFNQPWIFNLTNHRKDSGSRTILSTDRTKPLMTIADYRRHCGEGFNIINHRWQALKSGHRRIWRPGLGHAPVSTKRFDQSRLFTTNKSPGTLKNCNFQREITPQDIHAQYIFTFSLSNRLFHNLNGQRIFGPNIEQGPFGPYCQRRQSQTFEHLVRITFEQGSIHVGSGITLITITDNHFRRFLNFAGNLPFATGRKTGPAATTQIGGLNLFKHPGPAFFEPLSQRKVTANRQIMVNFIWINQTAMLHHHPIFIKITWIIHKRREIFIGFKSPDQIFVTGIAAVFKKGSD